MGRIFIFTVTGCVFTEQAVQLLSEAGGEGRIVEINLDLHPSRRPEMIQRSQGHRTLPQVFFANEYVGGLSELKKLLDAGVLSQAVSHCLTVAEDSETIEIPAEESDPMGVVRATTSFQDAETQVEGAPGAANGAEATAPGEDPTVQKKAYAVLLQLADQMRTSELPLDIKDRKYYLRRYRQCFVGTEFIDWMVQHAGVTRDEGVNVGQEMLDVGLLHHVTDQHSFKDEFLFYRFRADEPRDCLNLPHDFLGGARPPLELVDDLMGRVLTLLARHADTSAPGTAAHYALEDLQEDPLFKELFLASAELQAVDLALLCGHEEALCFWINLYNVLAVHSLLTSGPPSGASDRSRFFKQSKYTVAGCCLSLDELEHGILRGNRKAPLAINRPFGPQDERAAWVLRRRDPRVHFALFYGTERSPPLVHFQPHKVHEQLTACATGFLARKRELRTDVVKHEVLLNPLFKWYAKDFGATPEELVVWLCSFVGVDVRKKLLHCMQDPAFVVRHVDFNWVFLIAPRKQLGERGGAASATDAGAP